MLAKKSLRIATALSLLIALSFTQLFAATIGNDTIARSTTDTYSNFTIIDTNNSVQADGEITSFSYYAANTNPFSFVVVSSTNVVEYVSPLITPSGTGVQTYEPASPIDVSVGDNIGMYFQSTGTIPFDYVGDPAVYTPNNNGMPLVGSTLTVEGTSGRTYSLSATVRMPYDGENRSMGYYKQYYKRNGSFPSIGQILCTTEQVSALGTPTVFDVVENRAYTITVSGTYLAGDGIEADARYSERNDSGSWTDEVQGYEGDPTLLDLQVSADGTTYTSPNWGAYNAQHVYSSPYITGDNQTQLYFQIYDTYALNNTGELTVTICTGTKFTAEEIEDAFKNYSDSAFNKFLTQYAVTLFNLQRDPALADAVYDSDTGSEFDGMTVAELAALAETYGPGTPAADLLALKDVFDDINNNRFLYVY